MRLSSLVYGIIAIASFGQFISKVSYTHTFSPFLAVREVSSQDFAAHGYYTEPNTGITFYTSSEVNGTIVGDGEFSLVSEGGYTFGMALPPSALTTDSYDYIGLIVSSLNIQARSDS